VNISRQMLFIMVLLVWHYTTTCAEVGKTVAGEGRTGLGHPYQLNQSTVSAGIWTTPFFYAFIMRLKVEERVPILESYLKTMFYAHCWQSFFEKFRRQAPVKSAVAKMIKKFHEAGSLLDKNRNRQKSVLTPGISALKWTSFPTLTVNTG
jgi:hypothetical protein